MDSRLFVIFTLLVVALALVPSGEALKCYVCNSATNADCVDKYSKYAKECTANPTNSNACVVCSLKSSDAKELHVIRSCEASTPNVTISNQVEVNLHCKGCTTDLCNAASTNVLALGWLALLWAIRSAFAGAY